MFRGGNRKKISYALKLRLRDNNLSLNSKPPAETEKTAYDTWKASQLVFKWPIFGQHFNDICQNKKRWCEQLKWLADFRRFVVSKAVRNNKAGLWKSRNK